MLALCAGATEASKVGKIRLIIKLLLERSGVFANVHPVTIVEEAICYNGLALRAKRAPQTATEPFTSVPCTEVTPSPKT
jgi:hypothetical protein